MPIKIMPEWDDGKMRKDVISIYIKPEKEIMAQNNYYIMH